MNKKSVKFPFIIRTAIILLVIWLAVCFTVTFIEGHQHQEAMNKDTRLLMEYLKEDIRECAGSNKDSAEYKDGLNVAEANAVLRYYRFMKLDDFRKKGAEVDIGLYHVEIGEDGCVTDWYEALPESGVLMAAPFNMYGKIIVFDDVFTEEQINEIEDVVRNADTLSASTAIGYVDGRFFYPTNLVLGNFENYVHIETGYTDPSKKTKKIEYQDIQVRLSDGTTVGGHARELREMENYRPLQSKSEEFIDIGGGGGGGDGMTKYQYDYSEGVASNNYVVKVYMEGDFLPYVMKKLTDFYVVSAIIILLMGFALITGHNRTIDRRLETEFKRRGMMDSMAHEMKTPLSIIRNYGEVLKEEKDEVKSQQFIQNIIDEADGLNRSIVSMLDLSKMEAGTYPMSLSTLSVKKVAEKELKRAMILAQQKKLNIILDVKSDERILADEKLLVNIVSNFLSNAIKHTPEGRNIVLSVSSNGEEAYISVKNQGQQISRDEMNKIWDSYYGIKTSGKESSGLGLAIVRNACMMHNGSYGCRNEDDGVTFWAKICSMENRIAKAELSTGPVLGVAEGNPMKGLLLVSVGLVLQGLFVSWSPRSLFSHLFVMLYGESVWYKIFDGPSAGILFFSTVLILIGVYDLYKSKMFEKSHVILASEIVLVSAVLLGYAILFRPADPFDETYPQLLNTILVIAELLILILMVVLVIRIFLQCIKDAVNTGNVRLAKGLKIKFVISSIAFAAWMITADYYFLLISTYRQIVIAVIIIFIAWSWIGVYKKFNGKVFK